MLGIFGWWRWPHGGCLPISHKLSVSNLHWRDWPGLRWMFILSKYLFGWWNIKRYLSFTRVYRTYSRNFSYWGLGIIFRLLIYHNIFIFIPHTRLVTAQLAFVGQRYHFILVMLPLKKQETLNFSQLCLIHSAY